MSTPIGWPLTKWLLDDDASVIWGVFDDSWGQEEPLSICKWFCATDSHPQLAFLDAAQERLDAFVLRLGGDWSDRTEPFTLVQTNIPCVCDHGG
ncbi:hypothetical protein RRF57_013276 [Xylaria bambusicola]|uniref:Uncharacterized protein n=1 Tax=Xylaria bambusicola TaxID=326684 RepID=A0AAN7V2N0_9PEZI